ncbi:delta subunit of the central stalk of mitochondrial F1F0 ATP synthase, atp16 [Dimargaris xerosporica]|nr:delta subunit of the central stalk of mitochondrial F1F0 ATP synthase, atp16 [Dimargaris xerosporica]
MSMLRSARVFAASRPARLLRAYATEAAAPAGSSGKLTFSLALPHEVLVKNETVQQVNLSGSSGDMGVLADHVPTIEQLKPGVIEVIMTNNETKKWFLSGGFAIVNPDSSLNVNAVEAFTLDEISPEVSRDGPASHGYHEMPPQCLY